MPEPHAARADQLPTTRAVYRIDVAYEPNRDEDRLPFVARATRLSDDTLMYVQYDATAAEALQRARGWVATQLLHRESQTYYANELGDLVSAP